MICWPAHPLRTRLANLAALWPAHPLAPLTPSTNVPRSRTDEEKRIFVEKLAEMAQSNRECMRKNFFRSLPLTYLLISPPYAP